MYVIKDKTYIHPTNAGLWFTKTKNLHLVMFKD